MADKPLVTEEQPLIEIPRATFGYSKRPVVHAENLRLHRARSLGIFGPNGSGKTTLVRGLIGLLPPLDGQIIRHRTVDFGYLPQHRDLDHHWPMSGLDAASMAISARKKLGWISADIPQLIEAMRTLGVADLARKSFSSLSGGQQQRLLLAGALACKPDILILDEPTDGLDLRTRKSLLEFLRTTLPTGLSIVIISHDVEDIVQACDDVAWLHPREDPERPATVEMITPPQLADRVSHLARRAS